MREGDIYESASILRTITSISASGVTIGFSPNTAVQWSVAANIIRQVSAVNVPTPQPVVSTGNDSALASANTIAIANNVAKAPA